MTKVDVAEIDRDLLAVAGLGSELRTFSAIPAIHIPSYGWYMDGGDRIFQEGRPPDCLVGRNRFIAPNKRASFRSFA